MKTEEHTLSRIIRLEEQAEGLGVRLLLLREMLAHREITRSEIAEVLGRKASWVKSVMSGNFKRYSDAGIHKAFDDIESAITEVSDRRGGATACCTPGVAERWQDTMTMHLFDEGRKP